MSGERCGNCRHLDRSTADDIGGLRIARCRHPHGVHIGTTAIHDNYVELHAVCSGYVARLWHSVSPGGHHV